MTKERERQRLSEMFSGIEVLTVNPVGHNLEMRPESESPSPEIADLENPLQGDQNDVLVTESDPSVNLQIEGQSSEILILDEKEPIKDGDLNDKMEAPRDAISAFPGISNAIPPPLKLDPQTVGEIQIVPSSHRQIAADESGLSNWKKLGIGVLIGAIVTGIILLCAVPLDIFNNLGRFALLVWEILCGIIGALTAHSSKKTTRQDIWVGAIQWSLVPVWIALCIIFLIYLLMYTNMFG